MADGTKISWTHIPGFRGKTWNPVVGCTKVSPGCQACYAESNAAMPRLQQFEQYQKVIELKNEVEVDADGNEMPWTSKTVGRWNRTTHVVESMMDRPLRWKKPRSVFVCSMSDLFHETVSDHTIDRVFAVMALCPQHKFQVLTKRPERMQKYLQERSVAPVTMATLEHDEPVIDLLGDCDNYIDTLIIEDGYFDLPKHLGRPGSHTWIEAQIGDYGRVEIAGYWDRNAPLDDILIPWPLPNVWIGTSCENQQYADERIPRLIATPAAVRFLSLEPLLGPIDMMGGRLCGGLEGCTKHRYLKCPDFSKPFDHNGEPEAKYPIQWVIVGAESKGAAAGRPCDPDWIRSIVAQCKEAKVPVFVKQTHRRGSDGKVRLFKSMDDFPEDLRIREFPMAGNPNHGAGGTI